MSNAKVQGSNKIEIPKFQMSNLDTECFDIWHSFDICLPARSRFGEGRNFDI
jgi:hypothetical protein